MFIEQLIPTSDYLRRIKLKVLGSSGTGKTALIGSMNCSYLNSFFRRLSVKSSSPKTTKTQKSKLQKALKIKMKRKIRRRR